MKKLLILSGKGGTGKTTIANAFIEYYQLKVYADCDVDAPNLHLLLETKKKGKTRDFIGMDKAIIQDELCNKCETCVNHCRFGAISVTNNKVIIDPYLCEGCGVCEMVCPNNGVVLLEHVAGELRLYDEDKYFSTAKLKMGSGNSGKLVTEVKNQLKNSPLSEDIIVIDGSPGIGCPVIASIAGVDFVLIVAEPTLSGISDLERIIKVAKSFDIACGVCVNKFDINRTNTNRIIDYCNQENMTFLGVISYDKQISSFLNEGKNMIKGYRENYIADKHKTYHVMEEVVSVIKRVTKELLNSKSNDK